jgi:hypothetical protein
MFKREVGFRMNSHELGYYIKSVKKTQRTFAHRKAGSIFSNERMHFHDRYESNHRAQCL